MKKRIMLIVSILAVLALAFSSVAWAANNVRTDTAKDIQTIKDVTNAEFGEIAVSKEAAYYQDRLGNDLAVYEDNLYIYILRPDRSISAIIAKNLETGMGFMTKSTSARDIESWAIEMEKKLDSSFFDYDYDVVSQIYEDGSQTAGLVELWQKVEDNVYTGNKVSFVIAGNGLLQIYQSLDSGFVSLPNAKTIDKEKAIDIAYGAVKELTAEMADAEVSSIKNENQKQEDVPVVSDSELMGLGKTEKALDEKPYEPLKYDFENRSTHAIDAYLMYKNGTMNWQITIGDVSVNRPWTQMSFFVTVNAQTGEVTLVNHTR